MKMALAPAIAAFALGLGQFGIEIEATTKVSVRNLWVKKLN